MKAERAEMLGSCNLHLKSTVMFCISLCYSVFCQSLTLCAQDCQLNKAEPLLLKMTCIILDS